MLVFDRKTIPWATAAALLMALSIAAYAASIAGSGPRGPAGGTAFGLAQGAASFAMLLTALLLGARKRHRTMRVGRVYQWMQAHVWLGLICYPIAYLHAGGLKWGTFGSMTWVIMLLFTIVWLSGLLGLAFQQVIPRLMYDRLPRETTYEQHPHVLKLMQAEALLRVRGAQAEVQGTRVDVEVVPAGTAVLSAADATTVAGQRLLVAYEQAIAPFLADRPPKASPVRSPVMARMRFAELRGTLPAEMHAAVNDLEQLVDERRQMLAQATLHRWLHAWLIVHVPLSYALAALVALHAIFAFRYVR